MAVISATTFSRFFFGIIGSLRSAIPFQRHTYMCSSVAKRGCATRSVVMQSNEIS